MFFTIKNSILSKIRNSSFRGYTSITEITIPSSVAYTGEYVFSKCKSLGKTLILTSQELLRKGTFKGCFSLCKNCVGYI